jgi:hypothetical protein
MNGWGYADLLAKVTAVSRLDSRGRAGRRADRSVEPGTLFKVDCAKQRQTLREFAEVNRLRLETWSMA